MQSKITSTYNRGWPVVRAHVWDVQSYSTRTFKTVTAAELWIIEQAR